MLLPNSWPNVPRFLGLGSKQLTLQSQGLPLKGCCRLVDIMPKYLPSKNQTFHSIISTSHTIITTSKHQHKHSKQLKTTGVRKPGPILKMFHDVPRKMSRNSQSLSVFMCVYVFLRVWEVFRCFSSCQSAARFACLAVPWRQQWWVRPDFSPSGPIKPLVSMSPRLHPEPSAMTFPKIILAPGEMFTRKHQTMKWWLHWVTCPYTTISSEKKHEETLRIPVSLSLSESWTHQWKCEKNLSLAASGHNSHLGQHSTPVLLGIRTSHKSPAQRRRRPQLCRVLFGVKRNHSEETRNEQYNMYCSILQWIDVYSW